MYERLVPPDHLLRRITAAVDLSFTTAVFLALALLAGALLPTEVVSGRMLRFTTEVGPQSVPDLAASGQALVQRE